MMAEFPQTLFCVHMAYSMEIPGHIPLDTLNLILSNSLIKLNII